VDITGALQDKIIFGWIKIMVFNTPFNNISATGHEELFLKSLTQGKVK
jgi:hypothetical protein